MSTIDYGITTSPGNYSIDGTVAVTNGATSATSVPGWNSATDSASLPDLLLTAGTYYLVLQNAALDSSGMISWGLSDGSSSATRSGLGAIQSESFQILGYTVASTEPPPVFFSTVIQTPTLTLATPLPGALPLFATGLGALGLIGWRKRKKNRQLTVA